MFTQISNVHCVHSCDGGYPAAAWEYWVRNGLVTGANYGDSQVRLLLIASLTPCPYCTMFYK